MPKILRKRFHLAMLACLPIVIWAACASAGPEGKAPMAAPAPVDHVWEGYVSQQKEEFIQVVTTPEEWAALWKRAFDQPAPAVDFERHAVACIFLGHSAPWLFSIQIGAPQVHGETLVIQYGLVDMILRLSGPFEAGGQYGMKVVAKQKGYRLVLEEIPFPGSVRRK